MNLSDFEKRLKRAHGINRLLNYFTCMVIIATVVVFLFTFKPTGSAGYVTLILFSGSFLAMGFYGIRVTRNKHRPRIWPNNLSREQNIRLIGKILKAYGKNPGSLEPQYQQFFFRRSWWRLSYSIHLFADAGIIAVKADSTRGGDGIVDFGASSRLEQKLIDDADKLAMLNFPEHG